MIRWRYYKERNAYVAFAGNVPAFNNVVGYVRRFRSKTPPIVSDCVREEAEVIGWQWEVRAGWFWQAAVLRSGFYHKFHNARKMVEWLLTGVPPH